MRVSRAEQQRIRRRIIEVAATVIGARGLRETTMREIAKRAKISDATIYKYFPTKESLLFAFFALRTGDLIDRLRTMPELHLYTFREQLHVLLETQLEIFEPDRDFIRVAYEGVFRADWMGAVAEAKDTKAQFTAIVEELVSAAVAAGEFEEPPFRRLLYTLLWDYTIGVTWYWLHDRSERYANTTRMIDHSLGLLDALLKSNVLYHMAELAQFLLREHLLARMTQDERGPQTDFLHPKPPLALGRAALASPNGPHEESVVRIVARSDARSGKQKRGSKSPTRRPNTNG